MGLLCPLEEGFSLLAAGKDVNAVMTLSYFFAYRPREKVSFLNDIFFKSSLSLSKQTISSLQVADEGLIYLVTQ